MGFVARGSVDRLAVLFESTPARDAHRIVPSLARAGAIERQRMSTTAWSRSASFRSSCSAR